MQTIIAQENTVKTDTLSMQKDTIKIDNTHKKKTSSNRITKQVKFSAKDSMKLSLKTKLIYAYGEGKLERQDMQLDAGFIKMNMDSNYLYARSSVNEDDKDNIKPHFKQGNEEFDVGTIKYNFNTKKGIITNVKTKQENGYLHAKKTKIHPNKETHMIDGKYTTCDADHPHFYIHLHKAKAIPDDKIISGPFNFVILDIPLPIGLPFGWFPSSNEKTSGILIPSFTEEKKRGFGLKEGGYYWAINDYVDLIVKGEMWTSGSWGINALSRYKKRYKYYGNFNIKYMENVEAEKGDADYTKSSMFWVKFNFTRDPKANPTSNFSTQLDFGSSKFDKYNSHNPTDFAKNTSSSSIAYTKNWPSLPFNFSANMRATQNLTDKTVNMQMPSLALSMNKQYPFKKKVSSGSKWYEKIGVGFSSNLQNSLNVYESSLSQIEVLDSMENGLKYNIPIGTNFKLFNYIIVSPNFNYSARVYRNSIEKKYYDYEISGNDTIREAGIYTDTISGFNHHFDFNVSVPFSTKLYGTVQFKKGRVAAIRHVVSPSIALGYTPDFSDDVWGIYKIDPTDTTGNTKYSQYKHGIYGTAPQGKRGSVSFSLANNLEMKVHSKDTTKNFKKIKLLESFNLNTSYNIAADSLKWDPIGIRASTKLLKKINVQYSGRIDLYKINKTTGQKINETYFENDKVLGHLVNSRITLGGSINSETFKKKTNTHTNKNTNTQNKNKKLKDKSKLEKNDQQTEEYPFHIPWNLNINYGWDYNSIYNTLLQEYEPKFTQTISLNGSLTLTKNWKIGSQMRYNIQTRKITYLSMNFYRDLHCWEMSLSLVPFGPYQSFNFRINIKSAIFKDVEFKREDSWRDNL